ncbi:MAG: hypothetical protein ACRDF4_06380 [Rhabdochlamydiaceae bacterium]
MKPNNMADYSSFDKEFMERLERDRMLFVSEIIVIGMKHGLTESQVRRILEQAESLGVGFSETAFVYSKKVGKTLK